MVEVLDFENLYKIRNNREKYRKIVLSKWDMCSLLKNLLNPDKLQGSG